MTLGERLTLLQGNDTTNLKEVVLHMIRLCRERNDWEKLINTINVIAKRRAQSKYVRLLLLVFP